MAEESAATPKIKTRKPKQRACDEKDDKGKLCAGNLKRWYDYPKEVAEHIGLPGAGPRAAARTEALAREIAANRMKIKPTCAARTHENDIRPIVEISERAGIAIEAATFLGSSPIPRLVEDWTVDHLQRTTENAVKFAVEHGLPSMYVTEDTVRTDPETVKRL